MGIVDSDASRLATVAKDTERRGSDASWMSRCTGGSRRPAFLRLDPDARHAGHALGEITYKVIRYAKRRDPNDLLKIAAWAFLIWHIDRPDERDGQRESRDHV